MKKAKKQKLGPLQLRWVKALESGRYKQCQTFLQNGNKNCCLGVACRISRVKKSICSIIGNVKFDGEDGTLPTTVMWMFGFHGHAGDLKRPFIKDGEAYITLTFVNDVANASFKEIAEFTRKNPSAVFVKPL